MEKLLSGKWKNSLGSVMEIEASKGTFTGKYTTAVSTSGKSLESNVCGSFNQVLENECTIGFVVQWVSNEGKRHSVTTWSGVLKNETISTTWLLTCFEDQLWNSTMINKDEFKKVKE